MKRESRSCLISVLSLGGLTLSLATAALGQSVPPATTGTPSADEELVTVEVTGSLIRSTERSEFNQVQVISAEDLARSGEVTVADYLRDLAMNSASSWADDIPVT